MNRRPNVVMGLMFFPRGGSAQVVANLARALPDLGWDVRVVSGSVDLPGRAGAAEAFFRGLDVGALDMTAALTAVDPMAAAPPMHPSYEDRPGAPDRVFAALDDHAFRRQVAAWEPVLRARGVATADVVHLHHLTPLNTAVARLAPRAPIVGHLHGTELLMLEAIESEPLRWPYAAAWRRRLRGWARHCARLIIQSEAQRRRAQALLGVDRERFSIVPNGFDPVAFGAVRVDRPAFWQRHLVDEPRGCEPGGLPGTVRYRADQLGALVGGGPVLLYVGRFTAVKRLPLLLAAFEQARPRFAERAALVVVGGFPGEWEGEHPVATVRRTAGRDVYFAGWHDHHELPDFYAAGDVVVLPSVREQFGQVLVEGMACGLPAIAVDALGTNEIVRDGDTGWLVPGDDRDALAAAMVDAVNDIVERQRRGENARRDAHSRFTWPQLARRVVDTYEAACHASGRDPHPR